VSRSGSLAEKAGSRDGGKTLLNMGRYHQRLAGANVSRFAGVKVRPPLALTVRDVAARTIQAHLWIAGSGRAVRAKPRFILNRGDGIAGHCRGPRVVGDYRGMASFVERAESERSGRS
jgi:hypothetical protein